MPEQRELQLPLRGTKLADPIRTDHKNSRIQEDVACTYSLCRGLPTCSTRVELPEACHLQDV